MFISGFVMIANIDQIRLYCVWAEIERTMMQTENRLLILGAGQYGNVVKELADSLGTFDKICFLDDSYGTEGCREDVIGKTSDMARLCDDFTHAIPTIGNPDVRLGLIGWIKTKTTLKIPTFVSPMAYVSPTAVLGEGVVVEPLAGVHSHAVVGTASYISMGAVVNHNAYVENGCHVDNNAVIMQGAVVKHKTNVPPCTVVHKQD